MLIRQWFKGFAVTCANYAFLAIMLGSMVSSACAMSVPGEPVAQCHVVEGDKLPAASGGSDELCRALERALDTHGPRPHFTVRVRVEPRSILTADVTLADGRTLPALHMVEMDRPITKDTLDRFGRAIVDYASGVVRQ
jgi:hypothetical protein